jgi:Xaa-Pro dipeptidase
MAVSMTQIKISDAEHRGRCNALLEHVQTQQWSGVVLFDSAYIQYYTGFAFIPTERPMAFVMTGQGERGLFVPRLEAEHAKANALVERVEHYLEYPDDPHPMEVFANMLADMGLKGVTVGADSDGYPWIFGYRGPELSAVAGVSIKPARPFIEDQIAIKSPAELDLLRESIRWANMAHMLLQRYTVPGATETAVSQRASIEANLAMLDAIGPIYRGRNMFSEGASAGMYQSWNVQW